MIFIKIHVESLVSFNISSIIILNLLFLLIVWNTPLVWAARKGHLECVKHLLAMGADVDQEGAVSIFST